MREPRYQKQPTHSNLEEEVGNLSCS